MNKQVKKEGRSLVGLHSIRYITKLGVLSAMAFALMLFEFPLPFLAPPFYELDFSELPVLIGSFSLGPMAGVLIELIKNLLNLLLQGTDTNFIGEFANFATGCAFVLPAGILYRFKKGRRSALLGLMLGTLTLVVFSAFFNYFFLIPAFSSLYGIPLDTIIGMGTAINASITNLFTLVVLAVAPFNLVKGLVISLLTYLLYKHVSPLLRQ